MVIAHINMTVNGSTGKIMLGQADVAREQGYEVYTFSTEMYQKGQRPKYRDIKGHTYFGSYFENYLHYLLGRIFGLNGLFSVFGTRSLIKKLNKIKPDIVHIHNIHGYCFCLPLFSHYLKKNNIKVVWTLHDCWTMTGQCAHFILVKCDKWKHGCEHCVQHNDTYPKSLFDASKLMWKLKKKWITSIQDICFITPSQWLADIVEESYLKKYDVEVVNNGINLEIFKPVESDFRKKYHISESKKILLGVAFDWGIRKGLDVFLKLEECLDREKYQIVLVGTNEIIDQSLPESIISIHRTQNQQELAKIYSTADVFVNPTREDNYPTVNMEAIACGTPVVTFQTGGSAEIIDETCGIAVACDDFDAFLSTIIAVCEDKKIDQYACIQKAEEYDEFTRTAKVMDIYNRMMTK